MKGWVEKEIHKYFAWRQVFKSDIKDLTAEMEVMRKGLDRERIRSSELEIKLAALNQDMTFQIQVIQWPIYLCSS